MKCRTEQSEWETVINIADTRQPQTNIGSSTTVDNLVSTEIVAEYQLHTITTLMYTGRSIISSVM